MGSMGRETFVTKFARLSLGKVTIPTKTPYVLRDYQRDAIDAVKNAFSNGIRRAAVVLATGGGKTVVFSHLIPQIQPREPHRHKTLVLAHKEELVYQAAACLEKVNLEVGVAIDMRKLKPEEESNIIVASVPTLTRMSRLERYDPQEFKAIIIDECHHAPASSWLKILKHFGADKADLEILVVGFTATMERNDEKALGDVFDEIVYERGLSEMIKSKELVDVKFTTINTDIDFTKVSTKQNDYEIHSLSRIMNREEVNLLVALAYIELKNELKFKSTLIFCVDVDHCKTLCGVLQREGINAQYVTGTTSKHERSDIIRDFKKGIIQVLCNVQVFTEGTDIPNIDSLILARPTKSRILLVQMLGRGLRLHRDKSLCHVVDIAGAKATGIKSVPQLFSLPSNYNIEGKSFSDLEREKQQVDLEADQRREKELLRREKEVETHKQLVEYKSLLKDIGLSFDTTDGLEALESKIAHEYVSNVKINDSFRKSSLQWIRLSYDIWGAQLKNSNFCLVKLTQVDDKKSFSLTTNRFTSPKERAASGFKCGNVRIITEIIVDYNLAAVLGKAELLANSQNPSYRAYQHHSNSPISDKQYEFLFKKLKSRANQTYKYTDDMENTLQENLRYISRDKASDLIFALKYSVNSLFVKWELARILGVDERSRKLVQQVTGIGDDSVTPS